MQINIDSLNVNPLNFYLVLDGFPGIKWYQCANWAQDSNHGGTIGTTRIFDGNSLFGRATREMNQNGCVDYLKIFGVHSGDTDWGSFKVVISQNANLTFARALTALAFGSASDTMATKPNDLMFGTESGIITCDIGNSFSIWLRRTITAGTPVHGQYVTTVIQMQGV
jgi:hypothetical protein